MPSLTEIKRKAPKKPFEKKDYRTYNPEGENIKLSFENDLSEDKIIEVNCSKIINWKYNDRPLNELGDLKAFSNELKTIGQQQPCIVRMLAKQTDSKQKYELIAGERRWRAASIADIKLKVIVKDIDDTSAAIIQSAENSQRKDLSDYAKGMSYTRLIEKGVLKQKDLTEKLNLSKQQVSRLMSFGKIPKDILNVIKNFSKINSYTAETILQLSKKGEQYIRAINDLAYKLEEGQIGSKKLEELVEKKISIRDKILNRSSIYKIHNEQGKFLASIKNNKNSKCSVNFSKDISKIIESLNNEQKDIILNKIIELLNI